VSGTIAAPISVGILGRKFLCIWSRRYRTGIGSDLLDRADADAICLAQSAIYRSRFSDTHLGAADQERYVGRVGIAVADETGGVFCYEQAKENVNKQCGREQRQGFDREFRMTGASD
jgi:hypothetical protein